MSQELQDVAPGAAALDGSPASDALSGLMSVLHPPERRGLHEVVLDQLLDAIRAGRLRPGDRLLETEIAERLGISRGMVREAVRKLEQEGLVVSHPHRGTFVARISLQETAELLTLRTVLEVFAASLVVQRVGEATLCELTSMVEAMVAASARGDRMERVRLDLGFHEHVIRATGHALLLRVWTSLSLRLRLVHFDPLRIAWPGPILVHRAESHLEFVEHLRRRDDAAAAEWMRHHIDTISRKIVGEIGGVDDATANDSAGSDSPLPVRSGATEAGPT